MHTYRYLIVGGGMTADAVCRGIRDVDQEGTIGLVGGEPHPPYQRPPLSKGLWTGGDESKIWRGTADRGVDLRLGRLIVAIDPANGHATDDAGDEYGFEKLVLATGGTPRRLGGDDGDVVYFRTLDDYRRVRGLAEGGARFIVIGGGFIGSEIAAALHTTGCDVTMLFPEAGIGWRTFPADLSAAVTDDYRSRGVRVLAETMVSGVERSDAGLRVHIEDGRMVEAEAVVAGLGILPRVELAQAAGLPVDDGIVVDEYGNVDGIGRVFAAGDAARFPVPALGGSTRVEHEDHANTHGRQVGRNAAGAAEPYDHLPFFYSDLFDAGYEAVGEVDSRHGTVEAWQEPNKKGVVAFVDGERRPRGILVWGIFGKVDAARELIRAGDAVDEDALRGLTS